MTTIAVPRHATLTGALTAPALPRDPFGVYVHIPFCAHVCPYCDFNTYANQSSRIPGYLEALNREFDLWSPSFSGRQASSVFVGGGTPSLLDPWQIGAIVATARAAFDITNDAEVTIEANPNDVTEPYCAGLLEAGVNRLSIGAQTLDKRGLRVLGRLHEASHVSTAVASARAAGFANLSLDFIYGWPEQTLDRWRDDLDRVLGGDVGGTRPDHLSLYGLIVEPGTPMADAVQRGILAPVDDDLSADFLELAMATLADAGWLHYEISNWSATAARMSRHNISYWRNGDYAGIGAGAHGHLANERTMNQPSPRRYIDMLAAGRSPATNVEKLDERTAMGETMMLGLRLLADGVSTAAFAARHGIALSEQFGTQLERLESLDMIATTADRVRLTRRGAMLANSVCAEFLPD